MAMLLSQLFGLPEFRAVELTRVINQLEYTPRLLGSLGPRLVTETPSTTRDVAVARTKDKLSIIPTSPIGAPPVEAEFQPADLRSFRTKRLAKASRIDAESLTGVLNLPELQMITTMQGEVARRMAKLRSDKEFTKERMRLGMIRGRILDADDSVLDDCYDRFGIAEPAWLDLAVNDPDFDLTLWAMDLMNDVSRNSQGGWTDETELWAVCGYEVYRKIINHPQIRETYLNYQAAAELRGRRPDQFAFGGITWINFRGSDDKTSIAIGADEAHFFPVGADEAFQAALGPAEFEPWIGQPGQNEYVLTIPDRDRGAWQRIENYAYPLYLCTRPYMLRRGRIGGA